MFHATAHHLRPHRLLAGIRPQPIFLRSATQSTQRKRRVLEQPPEEDLRPPLRWGPILFKVSNFAIIPFALCYAVFFADFGEREHVFSPARRWLQHQKASFFSLSPEERDLVQTGNPLSGSKDI